MMRRMARRLRDQRGVTLIELLVALAVFALFVLMIDAIFSSARTNARKTEIAADVQQNARVAADRLVREIRETNAGIVIVDTTPDLGRIVFKSARLTEDNTVFCLYTRATSGLGYDSRCFTFSGGNVTPPPYATPVFPQGSYTPIWQRSIGYFLANPVGGLYELHRLVADLSTTDAAIALPSSGGDVVATMIESFNVSISGGTVSVTLKARGSEVVQGRAIPAQEVLLPGQSMTRN